MQSLDHRVAALERTVSTSIPPMFIHYVGLGETDKEIQSVWGCGGRWERLPGETEQELKERAKLEGTPHANGVLMFQCT